MAEIAVVIVDQMRASRFEVDQDVTVRRRFDLKVFRLGVFVPSFRRVDAVHDFSVDIHG